MRYSPTTSTTVILDGEKQRTEYKEYAAAVPAWCSHLSVAKLAGLLHLLTTKRHKLRFPNKCA